ncbi:LolA-related protein [Simplicispira psychrophila]|uniref:LolA-related protein n=1 Tax=Simplicispira psychrophila TaxID=80882 RepID=UPI000A037E9F|nr:LolA-related protein [Simplicispira psychrophila]
MNSVKKAWPSWFRWLRLCAASLGLALSSHSYATDWTLPDLMHSLAQKKQGKAHFFEKKYIGILDKPLESSGELSFEAPNRLEKRTLKPRPESMLLDGDKLTVTLYEKQPLYLRLQDRPEVAALVESIRATLSGDQATLEKNYTLEFSGTQGKWQLTLTPAPKALAKVVRQIHIGGADANIKTIAFDQADGDRVEMTISTAVAAP